MLTTVTDFGKWLPGWKLVRTLDVGLLNKYEEICQAIIVICRIIYCKGAAPKLKGVIGIPKIHEDGTNGNVAIRTEPERNQFLVTARGSHKGKLTKNDIVLVRDVFWDEQEIHVSVPAFERISESGSREPIQPSTDSLLTAMAFVMAPSICVWVHPHKPVDTIHQIHLAYPTTSLEALREFGLLVHRIVSQNLLEPTMVTALNFIDHQVGKTPDGTADSSAIFAENIPEAIRLIKKLIL